MAGAAALIAAVVLAIAAVLPCPSTAATMFGVGVNWATMTSHPMHLAAVVRMLAANGVDRVKLFDADPWTVSALAGSGVQAMLAVPNDHLASIGRDPTAPATGSATTSLATSKPQLRAPPTRPTSASAFPAASVVAQACRLAGWPSPRPSPWTRFRISKPRRMTF